MVMTLHAGDTKERTSQPGTAGTVRSSASATVRLRTLSNYPMDHSALDTMRSVTQQKRALDQRRAAIGRVGQSSHNLNAYSRQLFENAININQTGNNHSGSFPVVKSKRTSLDVGSLPSYGQTRSRLSSQASSGSLFVCGSNGPTPEGSLIYSDSRPVLLNQVIHQTRPDHGSVASSSTREIRDIIKKSNCDFRVKRRSTVSQQNRQKRSSSFTDFVLVPSPRCPDMSPSDKLTDDQISFGDPEETSTMLYMSTSPQHQTINSQPGGVPETSVIPATPEPIQQEKAQDEVNGTVAIPVIQDNETLNSVILDRDMSHTADPENSVMDNEQFDKPGEGKQQRSRSAKSRRRVTWVDDVTVSSPKQSTKTKDDESVKEEQITENNGQAKVDNSNQETSTQIISLQHVKNEPWMLPNFICPSSEEKSRQARTKQWINTNNFSWSAKYVPLI